MPPSQLGTQQTLGSDNHGCRGQPWTNRLKNLRLTSKTHSKCHAPITESEDILVGGYHPPPQPKITFHSSPWQDDNYDFHPAYLPPHLIPTAPLDSTRRRLQIAYGSPTAHSLPRRHVAELSSERAALNALPPSSEEPSQTVLGARQHMHQQMPLYILVQSPSSLGATIASKANISTSPKTINVSVVGTRTNSTHIQRLTVRTTSIEEASARVKKVRQNVSQMRVIGVQSPLGCTFLNASPQNPLPSPSTHPTPGLPISAKSATVSFNASHTMSVTAT
ncbi:hypothetical protein BU17DRAFT_92160 [Hysterangium stoloniferum]|nr:hypothetical protein BU17DRAFT_92160 [Hysterangium stoloniferum]